jgi:hypothetical protein
VIQLSEKQVKLVKNVLKGAFRRMPNMPKEIAVKKFVIISMNLSRKTENWQCELL